MDNYEMEEQMEKGYDRALMKRLLKFAKPYWHLILISILLLLVLTVGDLARPYFIKMAIDDHINVYGRQYMVFDKGKGPQKGIIFDNKEWVQLDKKNNTNIDGGKIYAFLQYGKDAYMVEGELPKDKQDISIIQKNQAYYIKTPDKEISAIPIPKDNLKLFRAPDVEALKKLAIIFLILIIVILIINYIQVILLQYTGQRIIYDMRNQIFSHLLNLSLSFYDKNPVGKLVTRITNDTETLNEMYTGVLVNMFKDIFMLIGIIVIMFRINTKLALISMASMPVIVLITIVFRTKARKAHREVRTQLSKINTFLSEHISGMRIIQIFNQEKRKQGEFNDVNNKYYDASMRETKLFAIFRPAMEMIYSLALALLVWYGARNILKGEIQFGVLFAFISYLQMFFQPINDMTEKYNIMQSAMAASEKIFYLLDQDDIIPQIQNPVHINKINGKIEFQNVWFAYEDEDWVLRDVSFTINPGEAVAFVGATGAGKTSIISLICRFYDIQKGRILIDGIPIQDISLDDLRKNIGVVLQDVFLFTGDIESNIRLNNQNISQENIVEISKYVNADTFIEKLPNKYEEKVMERGSTLSSGQRQLLAFARALAFNPSILVLDEATANIDTETEMLIQEALAKLIKGRTTIAIAHRLSTIQHADKIIVLHKGKIREMGNHEELLKQKGLYYRLYELQYKNHKKDEVV
ncbi:ABC transporter ATP-binding protein [Xylanivirga thermophila]|uniref:ABC transporter ATP-binding protein n=1 Tax=Xylanivirga thermophila TaxID=2496273 RepID=UPI00101C5D87|nr:ABC transporter ATP-binding protein [Xylanivirga thermophila]